MSDIFGTNLNFDDFDRLLKKEVLVEEPVPIQTFVTDKQYLGLPPLSDIQVELARHITQIYKPETLVQLMGEDEGLAYYQKYTVNEVDAMLGKGSGKDHTSRVSQAYIAYLLHCLRDPLEYYGKANGVYIDLVNLAVNAKQAQQVFFDPLKNLLLSSPWALDVGFEPRVQEIFWFDRPVRMFSGHSESEGWEGYEVLTVVLDEIAAFKGLGQNVPVLTPNGWVRNGDIAPGDFVVGQNGGPTMVQGVFPMGNKKVFEVEFEDGAIVECSDDHIWGVYEYSDGRRLSRKDIQLKDFKSLRLNTGSKQFRYSVPVVEPVEYTIKVDVPVHPYIVGVLIGDGGLTQGPRFSTGDEDIAKRVESLLPENHTLSRHSDIEYRIVNKNGENIVSKLIANSGLNVTSKDKFIPQDYLYASIDDRLELLKGLMDSDGTPARGHGSFTTVSEQLCNDFVELCRSLGGVPTTSVHNSWYCDTEYLNKYMICPRVNFNPFWIERKASKWKPHKRSLKRTIVDVRETDRTEYMTCIKVSNDDGLYVVNDYVVTHNTDNELKGDVRNKGSASQIYNMARHSVASRFPANGKVVLLSFPRFKGDFIQQRYYSVIDDIKENGGTPNPEQEGNKGLVRERKAWALKAATWEVNPTRTREEFEDEFLRDPIESRARFMCEPPEMVDAYFRDPDSVRAAFVKVEDPVNDDGTFKPWFNGTDGHVRFIHIDLGLKRDRTSLCMVHSPGIKEVKIGDSIEQLPIVNMDYIRSWKGSQTSEVPFDEVRREIVMLCKRFDVAMVTFDQWQSADMIQSLRASNINADLHTVRKADYDTLSTCIYDGRFRGYWNPLLVEDELLKLQLQNGTKVDHPTSGSKDLADSVAGATFMCIDNFVGDYEVEIEFWDEVNYDELTSAETDAYLNKLQAKPEKVEEIPEDIEDWFKMI